MKRWHASAGRLEDKGSTQRMTGTDAQHQAFDVVDLLGAIPKEEANLLNVCNVACGFARCSMLPRMAGVC